LLRGNRGERKNKEEKSGESWSHGCDWQGLSMVREQAIEAKRVKEGL
jgi:hypothetical protein